MAEAKKKKKEKADKYVTREEFNKLAAKVRSMSDNWHEFCAKTVGSGAVHGKIVVFLAACLIGSLAFGAEQLIENWPAPEGMDAVLRLSADEADDTADTLDIIMGADGTMHLDVGGTEVFDLDASGNLTLDGAITSSGALDVDSITVNAGSGIDTATAGTGMVYAATATKVEIADAGVETEIQGTLDVHQDSDFNEQITVDLNANDEEILVTVTSTAARVMRILGNDANPGSSTLLSLDLTADGDADAEFFECRDNSAGDSQFKIDAGGVVTAAGAIDVANLTHNVDAGIDCQAAGTGLLYAATATHVEIADSGVETEIQGSLDVHEASDFNEDITVDWNASDEEMLITITNTAANPVRILGNDANPGSSTLLTLDFTADGDTDAEYIICRDNSAADTQFKVDAGGVVTAAGAVDVANLTHNVDAGIDTQAAGTGLLYAATATKVEIADTSVETEVQGTLDVNGNADFDATFTLSGSAQNVTNGQAITVAAGCYVLNGIGGANDSTNTITLAAPAAAGQRVVLTVATASTNLITIADSGTVAASGAILMDFNDCCELVAVDTSTWLLLSESDN